VLGFWLWIFLEGLVVGGDEFGDYGVDVFEV